MGTKASGPGRAVKAPSGAKSGRTPSNVEGTKAPHSRSGEPLEVGAAKNPENRHLEAIPLNVTVTATVSGRLATDLPGEPNVQFHPKEDQMNATETAPGEKVDVLESVTRFYTKGVERMVEAQKKGIDLILEQNAELVNSWKKPSNVSWLTAGANMMELATSAFDRSVAAQKGAIELMVEESHALAGLVKEGSAAVAQSVEAKWAATAEVVNNVVAAQKEAVDFSAKQTKSAVETAKEKFGYAGTPIGAAAESMQRGVDIVASAQKDLLDIARVPVEA